MAVEDSGAGLASSLTDLMTSLAVIFILLLVASLNNAQQEGEATRNAILTELQKELQTFVAKGVEVKADPRDPLGLLVLVPEGLLEFALAKSEIPQKGQNFLKGFIPTLAAVACSDRFRTEINSIVVEGHTDSSGTDAFNLPLSQARSMAVVSESLKILGDTYEENASLSSLKPCFLEFLSASGRGSVDLIYDQAGKEDQPRSRRVVFKIRVRSLEQRHLREELESATPNTVWSMEWQPMTFPPTSLAPWNLSR